MLLCAVRRILKPSLAHSQIFAVSRVPNHVILASRRPMATTYSSPPVVSIDDDQQSAEIEVKLAPLRKAVQEQVGRSRGAHLI